MVLKKKIRGGMMLAGSSGFIDMPADQDAIVINPQLDADKKMYTKPRAKIGGSSYSLMTNDLTLGSGKPKKKLPEKMKKYIDELAKAIKDPKNKDVKYRDLQKMVAQKLK